MKSIIKKIALAMTAFMLVSGFAVSVGSVTVSAQQTSPVCRGANLTDPNASGDACVEGGGENTFGSVVRRVIDIFSIVVGAISVIMIIIGGFRYVVSGGDSNAVTGAKNTILYALVGLVIVLFAQIIVRFVLTTVTNTQ